MTRGARFEARSQTRTSDRGGLAVRISNSQRQSAFHRDALDTTFPLASRTL
jgi:hypothetical protein